MEEEGLVNTDHHDPDDDIIITQHTSNSNSNNGGGRYLIIRPESGGIVDVFRFLFGGGSKFLQTSSHYSEGFFGDDDDDDSPEHRWVIVVSIIMRKLLGFLGQPMLWCGYIFEFFLNLISLNHSLLGLFSNFLHGKVVIPQRGSETFISAIGHLDGRIDLDKNDLFLNDGSFNTQLGNRALMDLCMMASKLAYENANVVKNVVNQHWKMHFVDFYNCWNEYQKESSTQVFILCDKPKDANLILISFRGTEPFDADDWITDFDYSWYEFPKLGKVHMGFLEALGLGSRADTSTFHQLVQRKDSKFTYSNNGHVTGSPTERSELRSSIGRDQSSDSEEPQTGEKEELIPLMGETTAYFTVKSKLKSLLNEHKKAKFFITGHSLGGALAILFPTVLVLHEEEDLMQRLLGVHTFGQPRIGNRKLGVFMEAHLEYPDPKYFRVVYCNDLVPRLPYDDKTWLYKHFGECLYFNSLYNEQEVDEEPNKNYFGLWYLIPDYVNAGWELIRGLGMGFMYGAEYKENWLSIMLRIVGLALPGISAHGPTNYVNSVRLGRMKAI